MKLENLLKSVYYQTAEIVDEIFWKPSDISQDAIVSQMRNLGINFSDINIYLLEHVNGNTRRFPVILKTNGVSKKLADMVNSFTYDSRLAGLDYEQKRERFLRLLAMEIADKYRVTMKLPKDLF